MNDKDVTIVIKANAAQFQSAMKAVGGAVKGIENHIESGKNSLNSLALVAGAVGGVVSNVFSTAMNTISSTVGDAVRRVDTLNNSTKVFQNIGFSTGEVNKAMTELNKSILGLPTSLDQGVRGMQSLAMQSGNIVDARKAFTAFNDAVLSSGHSTDELQNAIEQFTQVGLDGPLDAQTWNSLRQSGLEPAMKAMADMNGIQFSDLKKAFSADGTLTAGDFLNMLQKLDTEGAGHFASLSKQAKDMTGGIATGWANMKTAIARGIAAIIQSIGSANISSMIANIGKSMEDALKGITSVINFLNANKDIFTPIAVGIGAIVAVMIAWNTITKIIAVSQAVLNAVMAANPIGIIVLAIIGLVAGLTYFFTQTKIGKQIFQGFMDFLKGAFKAISEAIAGVGKFFSDTWNNIVSVWNGVVGFFKGIVQGIVDVFNGIVSFFQQWGLTILAVIFWPFALAIGLIIQNWETIKGFFQGIWSFIVAVFTPVGQFFAGVWNGVVTVFSATIGFLSGVFTAAWNVITSVWSTVTGWFSGVWQGIVNVFSGVVSFYVSVFTGAWNGVKSAFSGVVGFFQGIWNAIVGMFGGIGVAIGDGIVGAVKGVINGILSGAESIVNGFVNAVNGVTSTINKIPGVHIGAIGQLHLPRLATGGIVSATSGGQNITVAEGGQDEWVVPESKMASVVQQLMARAGSNSTQQSNSPILQIMGSLIDKIIIEGGKDDFTDADAINIAKRIMNALRAQGLSIDEMGSLR